MQPNSFFLKFMTLLVSIIIFFTSPLLLTLCIPVIILRYIIGKITPWLKPEFGKIVTTRSSTLAADNIYTNPKSNLVSTWVFEGNVDFNIIQKNFLENVIKAKFPNGEQMYPEFQQYITTWCGYFFWKRDKLFDINNHLSHYEKGKYGNGDRFTETDLLALVEHLINKKWEKKRPLWEVIIVTNYYPTKTANFGPHTLYILRLHHCVGDGFSLLKCLSNQISDTCGDKFINATTERIQKPLIEKCKYLLAAPFSLSYAMATYLVMPLVDYPWKVPVRKQENARCMVDLTEQILISRIKEIKDHFKVSFTSVIFAVLAGAERDMLLKKNQLITDTLPAVTMLPISGHPSKLRNHMTISIVTLPVGESDPTKRLKFCSDDFERLKKSYIPLLFFYLMMLLGSLWTPFIKLLLPNKGIPTGLSNFPGGKTTFSINGHQSVDSMAFAGLQVGCAGVAMVVISHGKGIRISPLASSEILTKDELREITLSIQKQIDILYEHVV